MKVVTALRELKAHKTRTEFNPSPKPSHNNDYTAPTGIVKTMDACADYYGCDRCEDEPECTKLYNLLVNINVIK